MNKNCVFLSLVIFIIVVFTMSTLAAEFTLKWSQPLTEQHPWVIVGQKICDEVYEKTDGRIKIIQYPAGALGSEAEAREMLRAGSLAFLTSGPTILSSFFKPVSIFGLPYIFEDKDDAHNTFKKDFIDEMFNKTILELSNIRTIAFWYYGDTMLTTRNTPVYKPEDLNGIKLRCASAEIQKDVTRALGASPTPVSFSELYMALQTGVVDGQTNPITTIYDSHLYEVQGYIILTSHCVHMGSVHVSELIWQKIPEEDREIILSVFDKNNHLIDEMIEETSEKYLAIMKEKGLKIIEPDLNAFKNYSREYIWNLYGDEWGEYILMVNPNYHK